jgi:prepilin peptidase CpaA
VQAGLLLRASFGRRPGFGSEFRLAHERETPSPGSVNFAVLESAMNADEVLLFDASAVAVVAACVDVKQRRIPNWLTYPAALAGMVLRTYYLGWNGLLTAVGGCFLAGAIVFAFYAVRAMGAGDLKLLAALGSIVGVHDVIPILLATGVSGGVLALIYIAYRRKMRATLSNVGAVMRFHAWGGLQAHPELNLDNPAALRMPYGLAIAVGTLYTFVASFWG